MKPASIFLSAAAIGCLAVAGYFVHQIFFNPLNAGIDPVINADGSTDYTVVSRYKSGPYLWVVRLPKDHTAMLIGGKSILVGTEDGPEIDIGGPPNSMLRIAVEWPSFKSAQLRKYEGRVLQLVLTSLMSPPLDWWQRRLKIIESSCIKQVDSLYGMLVYKNKESDLSVDEWRSASFTDRYGSCRIARLAGSGRYIGVDNKGNYLVDINCNSGHDRCQGDANFDQRILWIKFHPALLPNWKQVHTDVFEYFRNATIRNDRWPD